MERPRRRTVARRVMRERVRPYVAVALALALAGIIVNVWRPLAPATPGVSTGLDDFAPDVLALIDAYRWPRRVTTLVLLVVSATIPVLVVVTPVGRRLLDRLAGAGRRPLVRGALIAVAVVALVDLVVLPLEFAVGYLHERHFGFRTSTPAGWLRDWALATALGWLIAGAGGAAFVAALRRWPRGWPWRAVIIGTGVAAVFALAGPLVVEPLLLETRPLAEGPVRQAVSEVLDRAGEPDAPILVGDASRRTTKVNAYVSGLGPSRRVVLFDNLLELPPDRVAMVVAHELAHREHRDIPRSILATATAIVPMALITRRALASRWVSRHLHPSGTGDPRAVAVGMALLAVMTVVGLPLASYLSRRAEAAADHRALELTGEPAEMISLARAFVLRDLADPSPPGWFEVLVGTHPSPAERIRSAVAHAARSGEELPDLEDLEDAERALRHGRLRSGR